MSQVNGTHGVNGTNGVFHAGDGATIGARASQPAVVVVIIATPERTERSLDTALERLDVDGPSYVLNAATKREAVMAVQRILFGEWLPEALPIVQPYANGSNGAPPIVQPHANGSNGAHHRAPVETALAALTARERQVLRLLAAGKTNREIAGDLLVSVGTVKGHVQHLLVKLSVADRTQAAVRGHELGLLHSASA